MATKVCLINKWKQKELAKQHQRSVSIKLLLQKKNDEILKALKLKEEKEHKSKKGYQL